MSTLPPPRSLRRFRLWQLAVLLLATVAAGLVSDWFRPSQRLLFPRAVPAQANLECK